MRSVFFSLASTGGNLKKAPQEIIVFPMTNTMEWGVGGGGTTTLLSVVVHELSNICFVLVSRTNNSPNPKLNDLLLVLISGSPKLSN